MISLKTQVTVILSFALIVLLASFAGAQDLQSVKARMLERITTIDALKSQGLIGEGNDGYLHVRKASGEAENVVSAENADRGVVYSAIAQKEGTTVATVGKRRALQLAGIAGPGHWFRQGDGTWFQK